METNKKEKELLKRAKEIADPLKRQLFIIGILTKSLKKYNLQPVIVGGFALEFYTTGGYNTGDIDLVFSDTQLLDEILSSWGFEKEGRHWISEDLDIFIEAPGSMLTPEEKKHLTEVTVNGFSIYLIGIEDLIIDRLNAYVHWRSKDDGYWAKELLVIHNKKIDWRYLRKRCEEEQTLPALKKLKREISKIDKK